MASKGVSRVLISFVMVLAYDLLDKEVRELKRTRSMALPWYIITAMADSDIRPRLDAVPKLLL